VCRFKKSEGVNIGIVSRKNEKVIAFNEKELQKKIKQNCNNFDEQFVQGISYRPFNNRKIYYDTKTKGIIERTRTDIMQHFLSKENVGVGVLSSGKSGILSLLCIG
jgi:predicted helicase